MIKTTSNNIQKKSFILHAFNNLHTYQHTTHCDVILEGECYGKLAVSIRTVKKYIRITAKLAIPDGQVQVVTNMDR